MSELFRLDILSLIRVILCSMPRKEPNRTTDVAILVRLTRAQMSRLKAAVAKLVARSEVKSAKIPMAPWVLECALAEAEHILAGKNPEMRGTAWKS